MDMKIFEKLSFAYPQHKVPEGTWLLYAEQFSSVSETQMQKAINNWICRENWFPKIPELREEIEAVLYQESFEYRPWYERQLLQGRTVEEIDEMIWDAEAKRDANFGQLYAHRDEPSTPPPPML